MKTSAAYRAPFGTATFSRITGAKLNVWEDAVEVTFADGLAFLADHSEIRRANQIQGKPAVKEIVLDKHGIGFDIVYADGQRAEVSWSFVRELPRHG